MEATNKALTAIKEAVEEYLAYVESDEYHADGVDDYENAIFEAAVEAYGGAGVWEKINEILAKQ